jgi:hypothetical protein
MPLSSCTPGGREHDGRDPPSVSTHDGRSHGFDSVKHQQHVFVGRFEQRYVKCAIAQLKRIRCACASLVEAVRAAVRGETAEAVLEPGLVPHPIDA